MKKASCLWLLLCMGIVCHAQHRISVYVSDATTHEPLSAATVTVMGISHTAGKEGIAVFERIAAGKQLVQVHFVGYQSFSAVFTFPLPGDTLLVQLETGEEKMEDVVVSSTRSSRSIRNTPARIELISGEELEEKANMKPGDIRMMLSESTGIQTQQVSATSANASIRIQGLDGRYTQLLKDGFPLFAGFSGGLGLLQTPPLDLKQVEIIKGASSTLYGGGAIAGLVNLISKTPAEQRDLQFLVNGTSAGGLDINGFYGQRLGKTGITLFGARNTSKPYDPSTTGFTAIPRTERYVVNPKLFVYFNPKTTMSIGVNTAFEKREGGDLQYLKGHGDSTHAYFENNNSTRVSSQLAVDHRINERKVIRFKNAVGYFGRTIAVPGYRFDGTQWSTYSEGSYSYAGAKMDWIFGANYYTDNFREHPADNFPKRNYDQQTAGLFAQQTWRATPWLQTEAGLRSDYVNRFGWVLMPRVSVLLKLSPKLTSRVGGGFGYKTPTIFTEETEKIQYKAVLPVSANTNDLERSYGANADLNYQTTLAGSLRLSLNQLFFVTRINHPLMLEPAGIDLYQLRNKQGHLSSQGWETNLKLRYKAFSLFVGYTYTDAWLHNQSIRQTNPLTPKHKLNNVLVYEWEGKLKIGLEAYYTSRQVLTDGTAGNPFWNCGVMAEKLWKKFSLFINFENITGTRQTKFDAIYTGPRSNPVFKDIYAPLDGFVVNGGIKLRL